jgi:hypothetical protein
MYELRMGRGKDYSEGKGPTKWMVKLKVTQWDDSAWKKRDKVYIALR